ncbi:hypothetical protein [Cyanobacterium sp. uoEpiScrs1]|uniref:hypothetical protein n=1 Tax=Cyanobacterium sp. uoEpiScrs1 TaxID=2976343 RepID=UPI0022699535|nr:hypothetical protein [Cyanobacterium sp. uoEpiScrs1]
MSKVNQPLYPAIICLSLLTVPLLGSLLVIHQVVKRLEDLGEVGKEVFRSVYLPILNFPEKSLANRLS